MGFFSNLIKGVGGIARSFLGIPSAPVVQAVAPVLARRPLALAAAIAPSVVGGTLAPLGRSTVIDTRSVADQAFSREGRAAQARFRGGNGNTFRQTLVQTRDRATGDVLATEVLEGAPFIMRRDIQIAKRVIRTASKLGRLKGIRHVVKQTVASRTKMAIEDKVLRAVTKEIC